MSWETFTRLQEQALNYEADNKPRPHTSFCELPPGHFGVSEVRPTRAGRREAMSDSGSKWQGRGRIEYMGNPDDGVQMVGNPPEMTVASKPSYSDLVDAVVQRATQWREAEIHEFETDSCNERDERHRVTNAALCKLRRAVIDLNPYLDNPPSREYDL